MAVWVTAIQRDKKERDYVTVQRLSCSSRRGTVKEATAGVGREGGCIKEERQGRGGSWLLTRLWVDGEKIWTRIFVFYVRVYGGAGGVALTMEFGSECSGRGADRERA